MRTENIFLGKNVVIDPSSTINNVKIGDHVKIAKNCSIYGGPNNLLEIGESSYVGMHSMINGFAKKLSIGKHVSIAQHVLFMTDSGPNASVKMQRLFPLVSGPISIGDHCWIGAQSIIMPSVTLGEFCIIGANSFVRNSFPSYCIIGGSPAVLIRKFTEAEITRLHEVTD